MGTYFYLNLSKEKLMKETKFLLENAINQVRIAGTLWNGSQERECEKIFGFCLQCRQRATGRILRVSQFYERIFFFGIIKQFSLIFF